MKCRRINCDEIPVAFIRITFSESWGPEMTDADWLYCREHYELHKKQHGDSKYSEFFDTLDGARV